MDVVTVVKPAEGSGELVSWKKVRGICDTHTHLVRNVRHEYVAFELR